MNDKKIKDVYDILMTPIDCTKYSNGTTDIKKLNSVIKTTQTYWPEYIDKYTDKPFRYKFNPDCDMSDFACGFYEIIYKVILNGKKVVNENGNFTDKNFAGDTMTSISRLPELKEKYHCLANFWLVPMNIGRTSQSTQEEYKRWSKTSNVYNVDDFMDRFLLLLKYNFESYKKLYEFYFKKIYDFNVFSDIHFIKNSYIDDTYDVNEFSDKVDSTTSDIVFQFMKKRATAISKSKHAEELWNYFYENGLIKEYKETYLEFDYYLLNKEMFPYAYECPMCNRIIANDDNYSIPPICDECSKSI